VELSACPHVNDEAKAQLAEASEPPVRLVSLRSNGYEVKAGNEVALFRHEKTFYNKPGLFIRVRDSDSIDDIKTKALAVEHYAVNYVGMDLKLDGFAVEAVTGDPGSFTKAIGAVREVSHHPLILISCDPQMMAADSAWWMASAAAHCAMQTTGRQWAIWRNSTAALAVFGNTLDRWQPDGGLRNGVSDLVLDPAARQVGRSAGALHPDRRLLFGRTSASRGYPIIAFQRRR
jgi:acetyl-CoA decarbonylase/synthase complex subunit gamma